MSSPEAIAAKLDELAELDVVQVLAGVVVYVCRQLRASASCDASRRGPS